jgi:hypothetical protein
MTRMKKPLVDTISPLHRNASLEQDKVAIIGYPRMSGDGTQDHHPFDWRNHRRLRW